MATFAKSSSCARSVSSILSLPPAIRRSLFTAATSPASSKPEVFDLVCIGAGPAGLSLISALRANPATKNLKIAVIDSQPLTTTRIPGEPDCFSNRCSSLTPSSVRFLKNIGAWKHIDSSRVQPYHGMEVWDGVSGAKIEFDPVDRVRGGLLSSIAELIPGNQVLSRYSLRGADEAATIAYMCENLNLTSALLHNVRDTDSNLEVIDNTRVESLQLGPNPTDEDPVDLSQWPIVSLSGERVLAARLLVGADGANSPARQFAGISSPGWDYNQHGIVATLNLDHTFDELDLRVAYQRFLPTGPIALLPLPGKKASLVWSISAQYASRIKALQPDEFVGMVNAAFRLLTADLDFLLTQSQASTISPSQELAWREPNTSAHETGLPSSLPRIVSVQPNTVASFPLRMRHASTYTGHRVALIGDAAHTMHPLAGQGLNLGQADAEALAGCLVNGVKHGMDIGSSWCLDQYNSERWMKNNAMLGVVDKLQKLYGVSYGPAVWGRTLGLGLVNRLGPLKGAIMSAAAGP